MNLDIDADSALCIDEQKKEDGGGGGQFWLVVGLVHCPTILQTPSKRVATRNSVCSYKCMNVF